MSCSLWRWKYSLQKKRYRRMRNPAGYGITVKNLHACENLSHEDWLQWNQDVEYPSPSIISGAIHVIPRRFIL